MLGNCHCIATWGRNNFDITKLVFNKYPEAIHATDNDGETPLDNVINHYLDKVVEFFEHQIMFEVKPIQIELLTTMANFQFIEHCVMEMHPLVQLN